VIWQSFKKMENRTKCFFIPVQKLTIPVLLSTLHSCVMKSSVQVSIFGPNFPRLMLCSWLTLLTVYLRAGSKDLSIQRFMNLEKMETHNPLYDSGVRNCKRVRLALLLPPLPSSVLRTIPPSHSLVKMYLEGSRSHFRILKLRKRNNNFLFHYLRQRRPEMIPDVKFSHFDVKKFRRALQHRIKLT
jgi:hypothetical protein